MKRFVPLIVECSKGQKNYGVDFGGKFIHEAFKSNRIPLEKSVVIKEKEFNNFSNGMKKIKEETYKIFNQNKFPLILGGDHSISYGSIKGVLDYYKNNLHVLWIDSHTDINTNTSSLTKHKHGMSVSSLMNFNDEDWGLNEKNILQPQQLTYLGINCIDEYEKYIIREKKINYIHRDKIFNKSINDLVPCDVPIHISFDVDSIHRDLVPCTGTPTDRALDPEFVNMIIDQFKGRIVSMDIVEYNPFLGSVEDNEMSLYSILSSVDNLFK